MRLIEFRKDKIEDLFAIVSNPDVMKFVQNGNVWSMEKLKKMMELIELDQKKEPGQQRLFCWMIVINEKISGLVSICPFMWGMGDDYFITSILDRKYIGKGYGMRILLLAIEAFRKIKPAIKFLYADTHVCNFGPQKTLYCFDFIGIVKIYGKFFFRYRIVLQ